jgi:hypothetical protein
MESADPQPARIAAQELRDARAHFTGCLVRKRDGKDSLGRDVVLRNEVGDPCREHTGLSRPGTREHEQGPAGVLDRFTLGGIERY